MKTIPAKKISEELIAQNHHITIAEMDQLMKMIQKEMQPVSKAIALVTAEHTSTLLVSRCGIGPQCLFKIKALTVFLCQYFFINKTGLRQPLR